MRVLLVLLLTLGWFLYSRYYYVCEIRHQCGDQTTVVANVEGNDNPAANAANLSLVSGAKNILSGFEQFSFGDKNAELSLSANNEDFLNKVANYLKSNKDATLDLVGKYLPSEKDIQVGRFENLGLARADAIRQLLKKRGIAEERVGISGKMTSGDALGEPVSFRIPEVKVAKEGEKEEKPKAKASQTFTNMTFSDANFASGSAVFNPGTAFQNYAKEVVVYMNENADKKIDLIGHTDNQGNATANNALGLRRAKAVRDYLTNLGVKRNRITPKTKGETEPVATNDTEDGRRQNRRVNVQIK